VNAPPTQGVKGVKPRLKTAKEELPRLSREYLLHRNEQMRTKNLKAQMELARERGELISKTLVQKRAAYLLLSMRQRALAVPERLARQLLGIKDERKAREILRAAMVALLSELASLPSQVTNPRWLDELAEEEKKQG
jgi:hypothetical protein